MSLSTLYLAIFLSLFVYGSSSTVTTPIPTSNPSISDAYSHFDPDKVMHQAVDGWSWGYSSHSNPSQFQYFTSTVYAAGCTPSNLVTLYTPPDLSTPIIGPNLGDETEICYPDGSPLGEFFYANSISVHPDPNGDNVLQWQASFSGKILYSVSAEMGNVGTNYLSFYQNGVQFGETITISGMGSTYQATFSLNVQTGDVLWYLVSLTYWNCNLMSQDATVTYVGEPTKAPTKTPTIPPTKVPTKAPTQPPTKTPTQPPTKTPTKAPPSPHKSPLRING